MVSCFLRVALFSTICAPGSLAGGKSGYEHVVPAGVWAFVGCDDVTTTLGDLKGSALGRVWFDATMDGTRADITSALANVRGQIAGESAADPTELLDWVTGAMAFVVFDHAAADPDFFTQGVSVPRIGFLLGCGENTSKFVSRLNELLAPEVTAGRAALSTRKLGETEITVLREVKPESEDFVYSPPGELAYAIAGETVVVTIQPVLDGDNDEIDGLLAGLAAPGQGSLATAPDFAASVAAKGPSGTGMRGYIDLGAIVRGFFASKAAAEDPMTLQVTGALGIDKLGRIAARFATDANGTFGAFEARIEGKTALGHILEQFFPAGPLRSVGRFGPLVQWAIAAHVDYEAGVNAVLEFLDEASPEIAAQARMGMMMASTESIDVQRDVLGPLGAEIGFAMSAVRDEMEALPGTEDDPASGVAIIELTDATKLSEVLEKLVEEQGLAAVRERSEFEGQVITTIPTPLGIRAHYVILPDALIVSPSLELLRESVLRTGAHQLPTLAGEPTFAATCDAIGDADWSAVGASSAANNLISQFEWISELSAFAGAFATKPPTPEVTSKYAKGYSVTVGRVGAEGLSIEHRYIAPKR